MSRRVLFPYSDDDQRQELCRWSGSGAVYCTASVRERKQELCGKCPHNPDIKKEEAKGYFDKKR